jgi:anti-sigma-K factor RskA
MDYSRRELADRLAAEYVLGTLRGPARRRLEALLPAHVHLRSAVQAWERRLLPMASGVKPVAPRPQVLKQLQARLFEASAAPAPTWWQRLALWQGLSGAALAAVVGLAVLQATPRPEAPPIVVVLAANDAAGAGIVPASFVASLSADGGALVLKPVKVPNVETSRALELWAVPGSGAPRSLGLVSANTGATIQRAGLLRDTAAFAVSLEPAGGSPTGAPTGPILSVGKVQL